jgi:hypothetical protein
MTVVNPAVPFTLLASGVIIVWSGVLFYWFVAFF